MLILKVIIVCIPFCFCRELQNIKVEGFLHRFRRATEKERSNEPKRLKKDNLKFNLQLVPTSTGRQAKQQNLPRLVPVIKKVISNNKIGERERREPVSRNIRPQLIQVTPRNFGAAKIKPKEPTNNINKLPISNEVNNLQLAIKPKQFIEDSGDDVKLAEQPQYTTPPPNVDTQIERPIDKQSVDNKVNMVDVKERDKIPLGVSKRKKLGESTNKSKNIGGNQVSIISTVNKTNDSKPVSGRKNQDDVTLSRNETIAAKSTEDTKSEVQKQNVNVIKDDKKQVQKIIETTHTQNIKRDYLNIFPSVLPSTVLSTVLLPQKRNDSIQRLEPTIQKPENKNVGDNSTSVITHIVKNETTDVIEIKQDSHTEIVEKRMPTNNLVTDDYPKHQNNVQQYGMDPKTDYDNYKPDTTLTPLPYEYTCPNQLNIDTCHYKTRGMLEKNSGLTPEAETAKSTWRSWFNTEVFIEKSRNKLVEIQMTVPPKYYQRPLPNNYYNNFGYGYNGNAYYPTYSSYPYYVYSKGSYALSN